MPVDIDWNEILTDPRYRAIKEQFFPKEPDSLLRRVSSRCRKKAQSIKVLWAAWKRLID